MTHGLAPTSAVTLREWGACIEQVMRVEAEWGDGPIPLTRANLKRAAALGLDLHWWAQRWLPFRLLAEYHQQQALLWTSFYRQESLLLRCNQPNAALRAHRAKYDQQIARVLIALVETKDDDE